MKSESRPAVCGAVEAYPAGRVLTISEAATGALHSLHEPVVSLGPCIGDPGADERVDLRPPRVDRLRLGEELGDVRVDAPGEEPVQPMPGQVRVATGLHGG